MKVTVDSNKLHNLKAGDIVEYSTSTGHREHGFYLVCHSKTEGYFVMSLTGNKTRLKFYKSIQEMLDHQKNIIEVYTQQQYEVKLLKV